MNQPLKKFLGLQTGFSEHAPGTAKDCQNFEISNIKGALQLVGGYALAYACPAPTEVGFKRQVFHKAWSFTTNEHGGKTVTVLIASITRSPLGYIPGIGEEKTKATVWMRPYWSGAAWVDSWKEVGEFAWLEIASYSAKRIMLRNDGTPDFSAIVDSDRLKGWVAVLADNWSNNTANFQLITASSWNTGSPYIDVLGDAGYFTNWTAGQQFVAYKNHLGSAMPADLDLEIRNLYDQIRITTGNDSDDFFFKANFLKKNMSFGSITYDALQIERASFDFKTLAATLTDVGLASNVGVTSLDAGSYQIRFTVRMDDGQESELRGTSDPSGDMFFVSQVSADAPSLSSVASIIYNGNLYIGGNIGNKGVVYKYSWPGLSLEGTYEVSHGDPAYYNSFPVLFAWGGYVYAMMRSYKSATAAYGILYQLDPATMTSLGEWIFNAGAYPVTPNVGAGRGVCVTDGAGKFMILCLLPSEGGLTTRYAYAYVFNANTGVVTWSVAYTEKITYYASSTAAKVGLTTLVSPNSSVGAFPYKPPGSSTLFYTFSFSAETFSPHQPSVGSNTFLTYASAHADGHFILAGDTDIIFGTAPSWALGDTYAIDDEARIVHYTEKYIMFVDNVGYCEIVDPHNSFALKFSKTFTTGSTQSQSAFNVSDPEVLPVSFGSDLYLIVAETAGSLTLPGGFAVLTYKMAVSPSILPRGARWLRVYAQKDSEGYFFIRQHDLTAETFDALSYYETTLDHQMFKFTNAYTITGDDYNNASLLANTALGRDPADDGVIRYTRSVTTNNRTYAIGVSLDGTAQLNKVFASAVGSVIMHDIFPNDVSTVLDVDYNDGDVPVALAVMSDRILVLKRRSVVMLTLLSDGSYSRDLVAVGIGCASADSVVSYNEQVMFLGHTGIYKFTTSGLEFIGSQIQPNIDALADSDREAAKAVIDGKRKEYRIYVAGVVYVFNMLDGTWMKETYWPDDTVRSLTVDTNNDSTVRVPDRYLMLLSRYVATPVPATTYYIMKPTVDTINYGAPYTAFYDTNKIELEGIGDGYDGLLLGVALHYRISSAPVVTVELYRGDDLTPVSTTTLDNDKPSAMIAAPLGTRAKSFRVKISASVANDSSSVFVNRLTTYYQVIPAGGDGEGVLDYES